MVGDVASSLTQFTSHTNGVDIEARFQESTDQPACASTAKSRQGVHVFSLRRRQKTACYRMGSIGCCEAFSRGLLIVECSCHGGFLFQNTRTTHGCNLLSSMAHGAHFDAEHAEETPIFQNVANTSSSASNCSTKHHGPIPTKGCIERIQVRHHHVDGPKSRAPASFAGVERIVKHSLPPRVYSSP